MAFPLLCARFTRGFPTARDARDSARGSARLGRAAPRRGARVPLTCRAHITRDVYSTGGEQPAAARHGTARRGAARRSAPRCADLFAGERGARDAWKNRVLASLPVLVRMEQNARPQTSERKIIRRASSLRATWRGVARRDHRR